VFRWRLSFIACGHELFLTNRMHDVNPRNRTARTPERFAAQPRSYHTLHGSMSLRHSVRQIL
jgi:hypothetical protein